MSPEDMEAGRLVTKWILGIAMTGGTLFFVIKNWEEVNQFCARMMCKVLGHKEPDRTNLRFVPITPIEEEALFTPECPRCDWPGRRESTIRKRRPIDIPDTEIKQWMFITKVAESVEAKQKDWEWKGDNEYDSGSLVNEELGISIAADKTCNGKEVGGFSQPLGMPNLKDYMRIRLTGACEDWLVWDKHRRHMKALDGAIAMFDPNRPKKEKDKKAKKT